MAQQPATTIGRRARVLELDPDLAACLEPLELRDARQRCTAPTLALSGTSWFEPWCQEAWQDTAGLLVVAGGALRRAGVGERQSVEILGPGDVMRPWADCERASQLDVAVTWRMLGTTEVLVLDRRFQQIAARWPELLASLFSRASRRADRLVLRAALAQVPRLAVRLQVLLWELAQAWGRVGIEGVRLPFRLSHQLLAELVGAQRPSVSHAMRGLMQEGIVSRNALGQCVLHGEPPTTVLLRATGMPRGLAAAAP